MKRRLQPELMDQPGLDPEEHARALEGLRRINLLSRTAEVLWDPIARLSAADGNRPIRVLDIASGGGDIPIALDRKARILLRKIEFEGSDASPEAVRIARERAEGHGLAVRFTVLDVLRDPIPDGFDVITSTLFLHHLDEADATLLLRKMAGAAGRLVLVDDLIRSRWGHLLASLGCRLLSSSRVVHSDGPVSVEGAYTPAEALELARRSGMDGATLTRHWPQRFLLTWSRP